MNTRQDTALAKQSAHAWLYEQIATQYPDGREMLVTSRMYRGQRALWLLDQLKGREGGAALAEAFRERRNAEARARYWQVKRRRLARLEETIGHIELELGKRSDRSLSYLKSAADRLRRSLEQHDQEA